MDIQYSIRDFMTKELITFTAETPIETAIDTFLTHKISGAPVVDENGGLIGVLSEKDCMRTLIESSYYNNLGGHVKEYMSTKLDTIDVHDTLSNVADKFIQSRYRRFPITEGGKLVGQISRRDVLRAIHLLSKED
ncbi:MAG: CBS domain-containing protein [Candidatus Marinimicrobia bacterium]|jgi:CBS domain-containing protein|nr:CBS domain-containing protein [Candidatus Neomarinimicrobiota bacterium]MBT3500881.1 CBS domain-containing protein [Candidatus Neomarinimicrobiota bacterium]MBT3838915.1 CBS domain-containing protein [Candidatus Neomarinimicrobiota bacterium]MBT4000340.1 CBS domain-containing protein [Candidatus Neomarinimicrobiota bacterium]MBT4282690.1 CBS domain-containing protein [Candidatus Neomarinimicrobiota bacterium]